MSHVYEKMVSSESVNVSSQLFMAATFNFDFHFA